MSAVPVTVPGNKEVVEVGTTDSQGKFYISSSVIVHAAAACSLACFFRVVVVFNSNASSNSHDSWNISKLDICVAPSPKIS